MSGTGGNSAAAAGGGGGQEALNFRALQTNLAAERLRIMADLGLTKSPPINLGRISSSEGVRREALINANRDARDASAAARAATGGKTRKANLVKNLGNASVAPGGGLRVTQSQKNRNRNRNISAPRKMNIATELDDYLGRVRVILRKVNKGGDKEKNTEKILSELNRVGRIYFGEDYVDNMADDDDDLEAPEALTQGQFKERYEEETGDEVDGDEASFSDAWRHAALINVDTLEVTPLAAGTDYVFTWGMINELPSKLAGSRLVAIHADTEDGFQIFFPIPGRRPIGKI
jgi:hypothetical protein